MTTKTDRSADRAHLVLLDYQGKYGWPHDALHDVLYELLTDLHHLAARQGWDLKTALADCRRHYLDELKEKAL